MLTAPEYAAAALSLEILWVSIQCIKEFRIKCTVRLQKIEMLRYLCLLNTHYLLIAYN